jgi:hypothetical protein
MGNSSGFRILLLVQAISVGIYTWFAFQAEGPNLFSVFLNSLQSLTWTGQFNLDFSCYLTINVDPDLIHVLVEHKMDLLFNRQLRINQNIPPFADCLAKSNKIVGDAFVTVWARDLSQPLSQKQMESVFALALENFFLQINADNLHYEWLATYFYNLKEITRNLV